MNICKIYSVNSQHKNTNSKGNFVSTQKQAFNIRFRYVWYTKMKLSQKYMRFCTNFWTFQGYTNNFSYGGSTEMIELSKSSSQLYLKI